MPATLRTAANGNLLRTVAVDTPPGTKVGDYLYALHVGFGGDLGGMTAPTPGEWTLIASNTSGPERIHTKVWRSVLTRVAPEYTVGHAAEGALTLLSVSGAASTPPVVVGDAAALSLGKAYAPPATPLTPNGLEIRWVGALASVPAPPTWGAPPAGYDPMTSAWSGRFVVSAVTARRVTSTTRLQELAFTAPSATNAHAYTIIIPSAAGTSGPPPTPPSFPAFTPIRGLARMRYRVHDALTGAYRGELTPDNVTFDRRDGEAGGFSGWCPMSNRKEADKLARIIPRDPADLRSGPGRLVVHCWRGGVLWGIYWLHTAEIIKSSRLGLGIQLQGSTLDAYMASVALEEDVLFEGDQIQNARDLIQLLGRDPRSNMGFGLTGGISGVERPLEAKQADNTTFGRVLRDYARTDGGFGYVINPTIVGGAIERRWVWGSPTLDFPNLKVTFTEGRTGGEVTDWKEIRSALRGGTRWGAIGGIPESEDATEDRVAVRSKLFETPHLAAGWPLIDQRLTHPSATTDLSELERYAQRYASTAAGAPRVFSANVILGRSSSFHPNMIGGYVRWIMHNDWNPITAEGGASRNDSQRLLGWALTPATRGSGKDKLELITEQPGVGA
ncbi:hypothetical protein [Streptosporangium sp. NPDC087985]|uniref:hypothetical protein n=1 Tax=Streptosporangium sp. NPDC087985 TaxID=3366196 RepID=UPI00380714F7